MRREGRGAGGGASSVRREEPQLRRLCWQGNAGPGDGRGVGRRRRRKQCVQGGTPTACGACAGRGTRGAHVKHVIHGCDAGRVEAQWLIERRRLLPRVEGEACEEERRHAGPGDGRGVKPAAAQAVCAGRNPTVEAVLAGARAERTRNMFTMVVTLDVSKLSGWLNAAAVCRVEREPCGKRGSMRGRATGGAWGGGASSVCREEPNCGGCAGRGSAERT